MIYELNEMIDHLDHFFESSHRVTMVGGIVGTPIERFVLDAATKTTPFSKVLVLNGCQDYIGLMKTRLDNVLYYADIVIDNIVDSFLPIDIWKPSILRPDTEYSQRFDTVLLSRFDIIVVFNTQLLPASFVTGLNNTFSGKIIYVCDPLECNEFLNPGNTDCIYHNTGFDVPTIVDSLEKLSPIMAMARNVFGFETRSIDRKVGGTISEIRKINKRTVGRIDDCQYITNDFQLLLDVQQKQKDSPFRKNQKVLVFNDTTRSVLRSTSTTGERISLTNNSMLVVSNPNSRPLMQMRVYNSKSICGVDVCYTNDDIPIAIRPIGSLHVVPANILATHSIAVPGHRFNKTVLILTSPLTKSIKYSILKNSNNVIVVDNINEKKSVNEECLDTDFD